MSCSLTQASPIVNKGLDIILKNKQKRNFLKWGSINAILFAIVLYDIKNKCPFTFSNWYYVEYVFAGILSLSLFYYFTKYIYCWLMFEPIKGTPAQRKLLHFDDGDTSFVTQLPEKVSEPQTITSSPLNTSSIMSWHSSFNEGNRSNTNSMWGLNRSPVKSPQNFNNPNYSWNRGQTNLHNSFGNNHSPNQSNNHSFNSPYKTYTKDEIITDEHSLQKYLREVAKEENNSVGNVSVSDIREGVDRSQTNTLWNYWNNAANLLKSSIYQLSPTTVSPNSKQSSSKELAGKNIGSGCNDLNGIADLLKTISSTKLTKYVTNLRMWISATILQRITKEFDKIDSEFALRGFSDIKIGAVGLERLKKMAENQMVASHVPTLSMVIPFLEMSTNQEYLVKRIRELANGSGINDYRWNSSNSYDLNEHVTTDAAIIFHLFCAYMDSQLNPLPQPGGRPFYNRYVVQGDKKSFKETIEEVKSKAKCAILCVNPTKPKFNFISDEKIHQCSHDRNNLFCVIIHFLIYMRERNAGLLDGINLGRSGLNILGVIEE